MLDLKWIRDNPAALDRALERRGAERRADELVRLEGAWRAAETEAQEIQARRNEWSPVSLDTSVRATTTVSSPIVTRAGSPVASV